MAVPVHMVHKLLTRLLLMVQLRSWKLNLAAEAAEAAVLPILAVMLHLRSRLIVKDAMPMVSLTVLILVHLLLPAIMETKVIFVFLCIIRQVMVMVHLRRLFLAVLQNVLQVLLLVSQDIAVLIRIVRQVQIAAGKVQQQAPMIQICL